MSGARPWCREGLAIVSTASNKADEELELYPWIGRRVARAWRSIAGVGGGAILLAVIGRLSKSLTTAQLVAIVESPYVLYAANLVTIVAFIAATRRIAADIPRDRQPHNESRLDFLRFWDLALLLWVGTYALFIALAIAADLGVAPESAWAPYTQVANDMIDLAQAALLLKCVAEMSGETYDDGGRRNSTWPRLRDATAWILVFGAVEVGFTLWTRGPDAPSWADHVLDFMPLAAALAAAAALSLLAGRFDSLIIRTPKTALAMVYIYAAIQPMEPFFTIDGVRQHGLEMATVGLAFVFKLVLFTTVFWFLRTTRGELYFKRARQLIKEMQRYVTDADAGATPADDLAQAQVFVAAAMASLDDDAYAVLQRACVRVVDHLEGAHGLTVQYAARDKPRKVEFDSSQIAWATDVALIRASRLFVLVYDQKVVTSALVELGIAYAVGIPCLMLVRDGVSPPYLLTGVPPTDHLTLRYYDELDELPALVDRFLRTHPPPAFQVGLPASDAG